MSDQLSSLTTTTPSQSTSASATVPPTFSIPSFTAYGAPQSDRPQESSVLNYYFLLIAVFVVIIILGYYSLMRHRRQRQAYTRSGGQSALARDLETWPGSIRRRGGAREDGLDEMGEAPPPYVPKELEAAMIRGDAIVLDRVSVEERRPPDYREAERR